MKNQKSPVHTCQSALKKLKKGNQRYVESCKPQKGGKSSKKFVLGEAPKGQQPYAAILSCADSRVIPEHIFDAKEGDLFVVRVAGNVSPPSVIASLEYAVHVLEVPVIIVLGHEDCGAVKAAIDFAKYREDLGYNLNNLVSYIIPAINDPEVNKLKTAVKRNARFSAEGLVERSEVLRAYCESGQLLICSAYFELGGKVKGLGKCHCPSDNQVCCC